MPVISKIRLTNVIYETGAKRFNDGIFEFDGYNGVILLENGGGKTVLIQTTLQAVLPHADLGERKIKDTLSLEGGASHIAIEWILNDRPRRYALTAVTLFLAPEGLKSLRYVYDYSAGDNHSIVNIPFVKQNQDGKTRPASRQEMQEYYQYMQSQKLNAHTFDTIKEFHQYIENNFHIIPSEWKHIAHINGAEGDVEKFFEGCKTTSQLVDQLLIPTVERASIGNGTEDFVQIFERQREHFKKHRELKGRIAESNNIAQRISHYVSTYTKLHQVEEKMLKKKREAKSIYNFLEEEQENTKAEIAHVEGLKEHYLKEKYELSRKKASYELAKLKNELQEARADYEIIKTEFMEIEDRLKKKEENLQNLEIAELKANITESEDRLNILQKQLEELDQAQDIRELQDKLEENSGLLKGCFEGEKADLEKQQEQWEVQKNRYEKELATIQNELKELNKEKQVLIEKIGRYKGEIKGIESNLESVKKDILANPINETVAGEYPKWQERTEEIERLKNTYNKHLSEIKQKREELATEIPNIQGKIQELIQLATAQENELEVVKKRHDEILDIVKGLRLEWYYLDSIYLKHSSIMQYLEERLEKAKNDKEDLLAKERLAYRLLDYYGENEYFTGEPLLEDWLESWGNQFHLLDIGTRYIEKAAVNINKSVEELYQEYPLWPLVVITSEGELDKLSNKIEDQRERLTFPILILSQDEASQILSGKETIEERYVYPFTWEQNIHKEKFQLWKKELEQSAGKAVEERKHKEREEKKWQDILDNTNEFLTIYPYDKYTRLSEEVKSFKNELSDYRYQLVEKQKNEISIGKEMDEYQVKLNDLELESLEVGRKIARALDYFAQENNKEKLQEQLERKIEELTLTGRKILLREKAKERNSIVVQEAKDGIRELKSEINKILEDPTYKEVKAFTVVYGDINKTSLLEERQYIKDMLAEKQKGRLEIEREIKDVEANKGRDGELLKRKYAAAKYPVNESFSYPSNGQALIQKLLVDIKKLEEEVAGILPYLRKKEDEYKRNANIYETRRGDFFKEFEEIFHFIQPLASVKKQLSLEKTRLEERGTFLESTYQRHKDELEDIQSNIQVLDIKNGKYEFLSEHIEVILLAADVKQDLTYDRRKVLAKIIGEMESLTAELERHAIEVGRERNQFIHFLEFEVKDIRLREMAISGVRNKRDFAEILEWQKNMDKTLDRVIKIHEKNMMEHDKELSQFIQYLYTYLYTLAEEIRLIPKNTRVKIDDGWKEIFQIQVPGWDEEEGKEEIRKHVDWMISKLESDEFLDEDGKEDQGRIRKAIEKWLQSKQLLKCIMGGKEIRVKCRKVTNDGRVSSLYYSWENSNQWSGGEKWSKNMALFLGILNYVAEKRQHILPNQKRHRTVIMDNPFGKASSDHVLSPVFFIAEELGFQFIALTAHGEGRFIRDYFPVVYSCKLRPAVEGDTSILTKEKNINYAFFKDKDPMVIERIGDKEQLSIFGT